MTKKNKNTKQTKLPFVTLCTPTFNRRPFIPMMLKCFEHQKYPKDRIEWIIIDDGTDKIEDLVSHISQVKYFKYDEKMTLGKKRNLCHEKSTGDFLIYIDDDDYYPPERISHAVEILQKNPKALCAGSSEMYIYFKHITKMYRFGPYGPNHATAATFAFRRELLKQTSFDNNACVAEEKHFLKDYTIPFVQLDSTKTILVFSHVQNSFDKKKLLESPNQFISESTLKVTDFVKEPEIKKFILEDIDVILDAYELGKTENKPDVLKQLKELEEKRTKMSQEHVKQQQDYIEIMSKLQNPFSVSQPHNQTNIYPNQGFPVPHTQLNNSQPMQFDNSQINQILGNLIQENQQLKEQIVYLNEKMKKLISDKIIEKKTK